MPFVTKEVYEKLENQKKAEEINWEIANTCRRIGIQNFSTRSSVFNRWHRKKRMS